METEEKPRKHWSLKAGLALAVCLICILAVKLATKNIGNAELKSDQPVPDYTEVVEAEPADLYKHSNKVPSVPEQQQQVDINRQILQIFQDKFEQAKKDLSKQRRTETNNLNKMQFFSRKQYEAARARLDAKYRKLESDARTEMDKPIQKIQQIKEKINNGKMTVQAGNDAAWLLLPPEIRTAASTQQIFSPVMQKVVTGIFSAGQNPSAIIDHRITSEGDIIYDAKITKIYEDKVEFEKNGRTWTQYIGEPPPPEWQ